MILESIALAICGKLAAEAAFAVTKQVGFHPNDGNGSGLHPNLTGDALRTGLLGAMQERSIDEALITSTANFLSSAEGTEAVRTVIGYRLAPRQTVTNAKLLDFVESLFSLHQRASSPAHHQVAALVVGRIDHELDLVKGSARKRAIAEARELRQAQGKAGDLLGGRTSRIHKLAATYAGDASDAVRRIFDATRSEYANITIPTVTGFISADFDDIYVQPTFDLVDAEWQHPATLTSTSCLQENIAAYRRVVIEGDPGSGKSTAIHALIAHMSRVEDEHSSVPVSVTLRNYARAMANSSRQLGFVTYISEQLQSTFHIENATEILKYLLHVGRITLFLDGLDEVLDFDLRVRITNQISRLADAFPSSSFVVTCRTVDYDAYAVHGFTHRFSTRPLSEDQIKAYTRAFLEMSQRSYLSVRPDLTADDFMRQTEEIPDLRERPLLLGVLCGLYSSGRRLPKNRVELYDKCAEMLFDSWDASKSLAESFEYSQGARACTRELALRIFMSGGEEVSEPDLSNLLIKYYQRVYDPTPWESAQFAKETTRHWLGRRWLLVFAGTEDGIDYFRFSHRTFLEYFAAQQLVYTCADGADLWESLAPYVMKRLGSGFVLLCLELASAQNRAYIDGWYSQAIIHAREFRSSGNSLVAFHCLTMAILSLACSEPSEHLQEQVMDEYLSLLVDVLPVVPLSELRKFGELGREGVLGSELLTSIDEWPSDIDEYEDRILPMISRRAEENGRLRSSLDSRSGENTYFVETERKTVQELLEPLWFIDNLRRADQHRFIRRCIDHFERLPDVGVRLNFAFLMVNCSGFDDAYLSQSYLELVNDCGRRLWDEVTSLPDVMECDNLWPRMLMARSAGLGVSGILRDGGVAAYVVGDWGYTRQAAVLRGWSTLAHRYVAGTLGFSSQCAESVSPEELDEFESWLSELGDGGLLDGAAALIDSGISDYSALETTELISKELGSMLSPNVDRWHLLCTLLALLGIGDIPFVAFVREVLRSSEDANLKDVENALSFILDEGADSDFDVAEEDPELYDVHPRQIGADGEVYPEVSSHWLTDDLTRRRAREQALARWGARANAAAY